MTVAAYAMGAMANITIATSGVGGALDSCTEIVEMGGMVTESLMVMDLGEMDSWSKNREDPFKVSVPLSLLLNDIWCVCMY